ncbi:MAG: hypothetical protein QF426_11520 [Verrucomicrobiales bacterium]|nr:hypothetical protein [Verrucomicrobiales bacterium]
MSREVLARLDLPDWGRDWLGPSSTGHTHRRDRTYWLPTHGHRGEPCRENSVLHFATVTEPVDWVLDRPR